MRTPSRLAIATAVLGGGLLLAGPATAQEVDCDAYPDLAECVIDEDLGGTDGGAGTGGDGGAGTEVGDQDSDSTAGGGSGSTVSGSSGGAASLPFTGGEVTLIALAGTAALAGGIAFTAAGRKRKTV